jgi:hypothetical protein
MTIRADEIESVWIQSHSPLVISIRYTSGGMDSFNPRQFDAELSDAAQAKAHRLMRQQWEDAAKYINMKKEIDDA